MEAEAALISRIGLANGARDVQVARTRPAAILWKGRKSVLGAVAQVSPNYYLHDTVVPRSRLVETMRDPGDR